MTSASNIDLGNTAAFRAPSTAIKENDLTLGILSHSLEANSKTNPLDQQWLKDITKLLDALRNLKWKYTDGQTKQGRAAMGIINCHWLYVGVGIHLPVQPLPVPVGKPFVPGRAVNGDGYF